MDEKSIHFTPGNVVEFIKKKPTPEIAGQEYLLGFRGFLVIQVFIWTFLNLFAPNTVKDAIILTDGPVWQTVLRKSLSVLFWNGTQIYTFLVILSARTLPIPFFTAPSKQVIAGAIFRRGIRLAVPVAVTLAIITTAFGTLGVDFVTDFLKLTHNSATRTPYLLSNAFVYFNSVFQLFWVAQVFNLQSGNFAFPSATLWTINLIYQQSYTVFMIMVIVPYTRAAWRVKMAIPFICTAWWVQSWSWFSVSGLLLADAVMNMDFKAKSQRGIPIPCIKSFRLPSWLPAVFIMVVGLFMQYLWTAWRPDLLNAEVAIHSNGNGYAGAIDIKEDPNQPEARADNYLFVMGFLLLLESFDFLQNLFNNPLFVYLGKRSLSKAPFPLPKPSNTNHYRLVPNPKLDHLHRRHQAMDARPIHRRLL